jgi:hypothetical protein
MKTNWLTGLLPSKLPKARIMSFAYNANTFTDQSSGELMDHAVGLLDYLDLKRDGIQVCRYMIPVGGFAFMICRDPVLLSSSPIAWGVLL